MGYYLGDKIFQLRTAMELDKSKTAPRFSPKAVRLVVIGLASLILLVVGAAQLEALGYQVGKWLYVVTH